MTKWTAVIGIAIVGLMASQTEAQSLWKRRGFQSSSMFSDTVALQRGDILTIIVRERQSMRTDEDTTLEKTSTLSAALEEFNIKPNTFEPLPTVRGSSQRDFEGKAKVNKNGTFEAQMSVLVVDVQPNGNLIVEGTRRIQMDRDIRSMRISGLVRPQDVNARNTVLSENVANASITFLGEGPSNKTVNRGWLSNILDYLWPF